jgi:DNA-binding NtrC family response regulator
MRATAHILIVDDEPNVRLMFRTALEGVGYDVGEAPDGISALEHLATKPTDLIVLDLKMPRLNGMQALQRIRQSGSDVPVVIVTAHGSVPDAVEAMKLGAIDFLQKPLRPEQLRVIVSEILSRHGVAINATAPIEPTLRAAQPEECLAQAKRAINNRMFDQAEELLRQAITLNARSAEAHNLLGVLHELRDEHDASLQEYKAALKIDRLYTPAQHNIKRFYERFTFGTSDIPLDTGRV